MRLIAALLTAIATTAIAETIWLGTTTTMRDSGILGALTEAYEVESGDEIIAVPAPSGQTLRAARDGNFDLLITHDESAENAFMTEGIGEIRRVFMASRFIWAGPPDDPAEIGGLTLADAFTRLAHSDVIIISRADASGTSTREEGFWRNYPETTRLKTGQGMGASLNIANALGGYIFAERASFLAFANRDGLAILAEGGGGAENPYAVITLNPDQFPGRNLTAARGFANWLTSSAAASIIENLAIDGETPFAPQ